jgi:hypothetical protein
MVADVVAHYEPLARAAAYFWRALAAKFEPVTLGRFDDHLFLQRAQRPRGTNRDGQGQYVRNRRNGVDCDPC